MSALVKITKLRCVDPDDSVTDEVMIQQDGRQVWPPSGSFSVSSGNEVAMNLTLPFEDVTTIALFDEEDVGADDRLGSVQISRTEPNNVELSQEVKGSSSTYVLTYKVRDFGIF